MSKHSRNIATKKLCMKEMSTNPAKLVRATTPKPPEKHLTATPKTPVKPLLTARAIKKEPPISNKQLIAPPKTPIKPSVPASAIKKEPSISNKQLIAPPKTSIKPSVPASAIKREPPISNKQRIVTPKTPVKPLVTAGTMKAKPPISNKQLITTPKTPVKPSVTPRAIKKEPHIYRRLSTATPETPVNPSVTARPIKTEPPISRRLSTATPKTPAKPSVTPRAIKKEPHIYRRLSTATPKAPVNPSVTARLIKTEPPISRRLSTATPKTPVKLSVPAKVMKPPLSRRQSTPETSFKWSETARAKQLFHQTSLNNNSTALNGCHQPGATKQCTGSGRETIVSSKVSPKNSQPEFCQKRNNRCIDVRRQLETQLLEVKVRKDEKKASKDRADQFMEAVLKQLKQSDYFKYTGVRKSGSSVTDTQIIKPDEFDFDVDINLTESTYLQLSGEKVSYDLQHCSKSLEMLSEITTSKYGTTIPDGYVAIFSKIGGKPIVPRKVQEDIYKCVKSLIQERKIEKGLKATLFPEASGPAITVALKESGKATINIDICASIIISRPEYLKSAGWPRRDTYDIIETDLLRKIQQAKIHLVPKLNMFWLQSTSLAEKCLLQSIDSHDKGCRKDSHRLLKSDFEMWKKNASYEFPGISTMLFKHHLFWCNEKFQKGCWKKSLLHHCYADILDDLYKSLTNRNLPNYFIDKYNLLDRKDELMLDKLAEQVKQRKHKLRFACGHE